ncbi:MAG: hypothetical protein QW803_12185 [Candidatus Methanomethylicia archaeon]
MTVLALTADGKKISVVSVTGPSSYTVGGFTIIVPELESIHSVLYAFITGGYKIGGLSISKNTITVTIHYYNYPATDAGTSVEIPAGTDLSGQTITLVVIGV